MTDPKKTPPMDRDRYRELARKLGRRLDDDLTVQGSEGREAQGAGSGAASALDAVNGDPFPAEEADDGEEIPLPAETLARGAGRR